MIAGHMTDNQFRAAYNEVDADNDDIRNADDMGDYMFDILSPVFDPNHEATTSMWHDFYSLCVDYATRYIHIDALNGPGTALNDAANGRDSA